jgi:branched-chain amino acid transport system permease protein
MNASLRSGLRAGNAFGILLIFLILINFHLTLADLLQGSLEGANLSPETSLRLVLILLGLWAGASAVRAGEQETPASSAASGLAAGLLSGLYAGGVVYLVGAARANGVDVRTYIDPLSPEAIQRTLFGQAPAAAAGAYLVILLVSGLAGALLTYAVRHSALQGSLERNRASLSAWTASLPVVQQARQSRYTSYVLYGLLAVIVLAMPLFLGQYWNYNMGTIGIYVLLGLGLNIVVGMAGLLVLGYVAFFAIGAYTVALLTAPEPHGLMWSFWLAMPVGVILASLSGVLLGLPVLRMRGDYLAIVTLGFGEIIRILIRSDLLTDFSGGPRGVRAIASPTLFGRPFGSEQDFMYLIILGVLLVIYFTYRMQNSRVGRAWVAMREDEIVARANGINTLQHKLLAFAVGAAFAGLGGALFASRNQFTGPEDHTLFVSINVLSLVIVGGMNSIPGVILGAFVLKGLPEILRPLEDYRLLAFGALLVVMMILRPSGLWPSRQTRLETRGEAVDEIEEPPPVEAGTPAARGGQP